jgi:hypothetical protein
MAGQTRPLTGLRDREQLPGAADQPRVGAFVQRGQVSVGVGVPLAAIHVAVHLHRKP